MITVNPLFNRKQYLGKNTEPMPVERYLVEINYPEVQIAYKNNIYNKPLDERDVEFLIRSNFQRWMLYLINSHFRAELNVGNDDCAGGPARTASGPSGFTCGMAGAAAPKKLRDRGAKLAHPFEALACVREAARENGVDISQWAGT